MLNRRQFFSTAALAGSALAGIVPAVKAAAPAADVTTEVVPSKANPVLLNFNENSLGMAPSAKKAVADALVNGHRYPDDAKEAARAAIAKMHGVDAKQVTLGAGSSQVIQAIIASKVEAAKNAGQKVQVLEPTPTFGVAAAYAEALHVPVNDVVLQKDTLAVDMAAMKAAAKNFDGFTIVYFCNPNNPTGTVTGKNELSAWIKDCAAAKAPVFFLVDEAYGEYVEDPAFESGIELVKQGLTNLMVAKTFSKLYALAGLRLGYGIATPEVNAEIDNFESIDNINLASAVAATATLADAAYLKTSLESTKASKAIVVAALKELGIKYLDTQANFIYHEVKGSNADYQKAMAAENIFVGRTFAPFDNRSRLTLGTPGEMKAFVRVLKSFRAKGLI